MRQIRRACYPLLDGRRPRPATLEPQRLTPGGKAPLRSRQLAWPQKPRLPADNPLPPRFPPRSQAPATSSAGPTESCAGETTPLTSWAYDYPGVGSGRPGASSAKPDPATTFPYSGGRNQRYYTTFQPPQGQQF